MLSLNEKILSDFFLTKNVLIINDQRHIFIILWGNLRGENERLLRESALGAATSGLTMVDVVVVMVVVVVVVVVVVLFVQLQHSSSSTFMFMSMFITLCSWVEPIRTAKRTKERNITKGRIISKGLFGFLGFFQKTN